MEKCADQKWSPDQLTQQEAIALTDLKIYESWSKEQRARFQLFQKRLCMPFNVFHEAIEYCLNRPVYTHEFGLNLDGIKEEFLGEKQAPTFAEIIEMIPKEKILIIS